VNSFGPVESDSEGFQFVRPVSLIEEMLAREGVDAKQSPTTKKYVKGLDAYFAGDKENAVANLAAVVEDQPANGVAADYLKKSKALPEPKSESSVGKILLLVLGAVVALLLILGLLLMIRKRSGRVGPAAPAPQPGVPPTQAPQPEAMVSSSLSSDSSRAVASPTSDDSQRVLETRLETREGSGPAGFGSSPVRAESSPTASVVQDPQVGVGLPAGGRQASSAAPSVCASCGTSLSPTAKFCAECGEKT